MALRCWDLGRAAPVPHTHPAGPGLPLPSLPTGLLLGREGARSRPPRARLAAVRPGFGSCQCPTAAAAAAHHTTPSHGRSQGAAPAACCPAAGLPPAPPGRVAALSSHSCPFPVVFCVLSAACDSSSVAFAASRGSDCHQAVQHPCQTLHLPAAARCSPGLIAARQPCGAGEMWMGAAPRGPPGAGLTSRPRHPGVLP